MRTCLGAGAHLAQQAHLQRCHPPVSPHRAAPAAAAGTRCTGLRLWCCWGEEGGGGAGGCLQASRGGGVQRAAWAARTTVHPDVLAAADRGACGGQRWHSAGTAVLALLAGSLAGSLACCSTHQAWAVPFRLQGGKRDWCCQCARARRLPDICTRLVQCVARRHRWVPAAAHVGSVAAVGAIARLWPGYTRAARYCGPADSAWELRLPSMSTSCDSAAPVLLPLSCRRLLGHCENPSGHALPQLVKGARGRAVHAVHHAKEQHPWGA